MDIDELKVKSDMGHTHEVLIMDEVSGYLGTFPSKSKKTADVFAAVTQYINSTFGAKG